MEQNNSVLMEACKLGNLAAAEKALDEGADVNYKDKDNSHNTPLDITSYRGNIELAMMLIRRGADVNSKNSWGLTALHIASMDGNIKLADLLIENGADVNIKDDFGKTPLNTALNKGDDEEVVNLLLTKGASIDKKDITAAERQNTPGLVNILNSWTKVLNGAMLHKEITGIHIDPENFENMKDYMGKEGTDFGGRRRRTIKRKSNKRRRTNKRRTNKRKSNKRRTRRM